MWQGQEPPSGETRSHGRDRHPWGDSSLLRPRGPALVTQCPGNSNVLLDVWPAHRGNGGLLTGCPHPDTGLPGHPSRPSQPAATEQPPPEFLMEPRQGVRTHHPPAPPPPQQSWRLPRDPGPELQQSITTTSLHRWGQALPTSAGGQTRPCPQRNKLIAWTQLHRNNSNVHELVSGNVSKRDRGAVMTSEQHPPPVLTISLQQTPLRLAPQSLPTCCSPAQNNFPCVLHRALALYPLLSLCVLTSSSRQPSKTTLSGAPVSDPAASLNTQDGTCGSVCSFPSTRTLVIQRQGLCLLFLRLWPTVGASKICIQ